MKITKTNISKKPVKGLVLGCASGLCVIFLLTLIITFIIEKSGKLPYTALNYAGLAAGAAGAFAGGYVSARIIKNSGLVYGAVIGAILFLVFLLTGVLRSQDAPGLFTLYRLTAFVTASMLGGILGVNRKNSFKVK